MKKKVLFVCIENSNRSQMAQAFATIYGHQTIESFSAGSKPSGIINPKAIAAMQEIGYDMKQHASKSIDEIAEYAPFDAVVTMGCGDACPHIAAHLRLDWQIPDPRNLEPKAFNSVRDLIKKQVVELLEQLNKMG